MLRFVSVPAAERIHGGRPTSRGRPPAAVFGGWETGRWGRLPPKGFSRVWTLEQVRAGSAGGQCLRLGFTHPSPTSRGLGCFVSFLFRRQRRIHGGRPTSRGRPPCGGFGGWETGRWGRLPPKGFSRVWTLERVRAGSAGGQCLRLGFTHPSPMSRGLGCFVSFLFRRQSAYTADGPRAGGRQCRRPVPLAPYSRAQAPRAGGLGASFRFCSGGRAHTRRTAHVQGPSACGGRGTGDGGKTDDGSPKPPQAASPCSWTCRRLLPPPPQPTRTAAHPPPCSWGGCASTRSRRHCQPALPATLLVGRVCVYTEPKALSAGTAGPPARGAGVRLHGAEGTGRRHRRPPAEAELALVEDGRLAGGDGALGRVERDARSVSVNDRARGL